MFLTEDEVLMEIKTQVKKSQCEIFNFVDLCSGVGIVWSTTTRTRVNDATAVTFSIKTLSSVRKHLQKVVCFILFYLVTSISRPLLNRLVVWQSSSKLERGYNSAII